MYREARSVYVRLSAGGARTLAERNDVEIVFDAGKYGAMLVTNDGGSRSQPAGILGNAGDLARLGITVMRARDAVARVEQKTRERDERARQLAALDSYPVPDWVGKD